MPKLLITLIFIVMALPAYGEEGVYRLYKKEHADGTVEFTNQPREGYEEIRVREPLEFKSPSLPPRRPVKKSEFPGYEELVITSPEDESTFRNQEAETVQIAWQVTPRLRAGHRFQVLLDGKPYGEPTRSNALEILGLQRGSHRISVQVVTPEDKTIISSAETAIHVHKTSVAIP